LGVADMKTEFPGLTVRILVIDRADPWLNKILIYEFTIKIALLLAGLAFWYYPVIETYFLE